MALAVGGILIGGWYGEALGCTPGAGAAVFTVDATGDMVDDADGVTTFREAIEAANANPGCDTINFAAPLKGQTITMDPTLAHPTNVTNGAPLVQDPVNIVGPGSDQLTFTYTNGGAGTFDLLNNGNQNISIAGITVDAGNTA